VGVLKVLILELTAPDALATGAIAIGEVTALNHEAGNNAVEGASLKGERLPSGLADALIAQTQVLEVLTRLRDGLVEELHDNTPGRLSADRNIEEDTQLVVLALLALLVSLRLLGSRASSLLLRLALLPLRLLLDLTAVDNRHSRARGAALRADGLHLLNDVHALLNAPEHDMLPVQPRRLRDSNEELRAIRVGTGVRHRQQARASVPKLEVLIGELRTVNALTASTVATSEVTTLAHEARNDSVELGALRNAKEKKIREQLLTR